MKKLTAMLILAAMLLASCAGDANTATNTTEITTVEEGSALPSETTETTAESADTTVLTTVETTETVTEEPIDIEELLSDYTVYDVTTETYLAPLNNTDKPEKIALRFTDFDGLLFFADYTLSEYNVHCYYITRIYSNGVDIPVLSEQFEYGYIGFSIKSINGTMFIEYSNGNGTCGQYYIIRDSAYYLLENNPSKTGYVLHVYMDDDGELTYQKTAQKYYVFDFEAFLMAYESDDDFYEETGSVTFENGEAVLVPNKVKIIGDGHTWSDTVDRFCEYYGVDSVGELAKLYKQYVTEGKGREFMELSFPKFDINSEECLMYRLLGMTVEEIEAEFGKLELYAIIAGGTPCYQLTDLGILFYFSSYYSDDFNEPLPRDLVPVFIETNGYNDIIYPCVYEGMDSKELIEMIGIDELNYSIFEIGGGFVSEHNINGRVIHIRWDLSEEDMEDFINVFYTGNVNERDPMLEDIAAKMKSGEIRTKVMNIFVFK